MRTASSIAWIGLLLFGCGRSPYAGYKEVGSKVYMRYLTLGEGERLVSDSDSVLMRFRVSLPGDDPGSYLSTERWYAVRDLRMGALVPILRRMHEGDSMSVKAPAALWPWTALAAGTAEAPPDTTTLTTEISMRQARSPAESRAERDRLRRADPEGYERKVMAAYLERTGEEWKPWGTSEMRYLIAGHATDTNRVRAGHVVSVSWTGIRLEDGKIFDVTDDRTGSFTWRYGDTEQVIRGVEVAVSLLRVGQEGRFVLPSSMAFGAKGISGALEPHTPVQYTVRLLSAGRGDLNP